MSQKAAMRLRRRFKINFRDLAKRGRPKYPRPVSLEKAAKRLRDLITKQQLMKNRKKKAG
jgi:hypothetical protein